MQKVKNILRDIAVAFLTGLAGGLVLVAVFAALGAVVKGVTGAVEAPRTVVLLTGGFLMLYAALCMLKGGNLPPDAFTLRPWKQQKADPAETEPLRLFRVLPRQYTYFIIACGVLATSLIPECIALYALA
ncbi:MAG: hypothetical protein Q4C53_02760 [Clostridia bacterium]|nr:hypothetical protein [Clostridia bacterium]